MKTINIPWKDYGPSVWNDTCIDILEQFGLPGHKYTIEVATEGMKFHFKNQKDAVFCRILVSEKL